MRVIASQPRERIVGLAVLRPVDRRNLAAPAAPFGMFHGQQRFAAPMEMVGDERHFPVIFGHGEGHQASPSIGGPPAAWPLMPAPAGTAGTSGSSAPFTSS